jgi:hypothetical protein
MVFKIKIRFVGISPRKTHTGQSSCPTPHAGRFFRTFPISKGSCKELPRGQEANFYSAASMAKRGQVLTFLLQGQSQIMLGPALPHLSPGSPVTPIFYRIEPKVVS